MMTKDDAIVFDSFLEPLYQGKLLMLFSIYYLIILNFFFIKNNNRLYSFLLNFKTRT